MALTKCLECGKEVSDKAAACPNCGNPDQPNKVSVQLDTAPQKRRKYRVRLIIFMPMFVFGSLFFIGSLMSGEGGKIAFWFIVALVGFIGSIASRLGHWLSEP